MTPAENGILGMFGHSHLKFPFWGEEKESRQNRKSQYFSFEVESESLKKVAAIQCKRLAERKLEAEGSVRQDWQFYHGCLWLLCNLSS